MAERESHTTERIEICRNCQGAGTLRTAAGGKITCNVCDGHGRVLIRKLIRIFVETIKIQ